MRSTDKSESIYKHPDGSLESYRNESYRLSLMPVFLYGTALIVIFLLGVLGIETLIALKFQYQCPAGEVYINREVNNGS